MATRQKRWVLRDRVWRSRKIARQYRQTCGCSAPECRRRRRIMAACKAGGSYQPLRDWIDSMQRAAVARIAEAGR